MNLEIRFAELLFGADGEFPLSVVPQHPYLLALVLFKRDAVDPRQLLHVLDLLNLARLERKPQRDSNAPKISATSLSEWR